MRFAKHETFNIREGWLFKGMSAIQTCEEAETSPTIFFEKTAPEQFGLGTAMVRSLRFWLVASGIASEDVRQRTHRLTPFGEQVWHWDRYIDDIGTLWLLHYKIVRNERQATTWYWFFNWYVPITFTKASAISALSNWVISKDSAQPITEHTLAKDVDCLVATYLPDETQHTPEDLLDCPLSRLGLLSKVSNGREERYRLMGATQERLHPLVLLYVLVDWQRKNSPNVRQIGLSQVLREPMNAGRVFGLNTALLADLIADLNQVHPDMRVALERTAGLDQLTLPDVSSEAILTRYYEQRFGQGGVRL